MVRTSTCVWMLVNLVKKSLLRDLLGRGSWVSLFNVFFHNGHTLYFLRFWFMGWYSIHLAPSWPMSYPELFYIRSVSMSVFSFLLIVQGISPWTVSFSMGGDSFSLNNCTESVCWIQWDEIPRFCLRQSLGERDGYKGTGNIYPRHCAWSFE